ncbi:MAG: DNA-processing protein DprA [Candidatus Omnitrophota bacterium]
MTSSEAEEVRAFLALNRLRIEGRRRVVALLSEGKSAREIVTLMESEDLLKELPAQENTPSFNAEREIELCAQKGIGFLLYSDSDYPAILKEIADPPLLLYKKGALLENDRNAIAIVGTRHPSFYGRMQAKKFSQELAARGLTIVSGLARGIDQVAHDGALCVSYGRTIAVMGCGLDVIYPKEHEILFQRISERGAVLSEYPLGTPPLPENFPRRNRILSGLSYATFVVEAHSRSGSLITAHQAVEQGREVFALPGPVDQLTSRGCHQLIKEGACLVETPEDILIALADRLKFENKFEPAEKVLRSEDIPPNIPSPPVGEGQDEGGLVFPHPTLSQEGEGKTRECLKIHQDLGSDPVPLILDEETSVIEDLLKEEGALAQDEILEFTGLDPAKLPALLLQLELAKKIKRMQEGKYSLP